jgi:hypothetical protein
LSCPGFLKAALQARLAECQFELTWWIAGVRGASQDSK